MAVIIDIPGIGNVEAKNAASESTLRELVKAMTAVEKAMSGKSGQKGKGKDDDDKDDKGPGFLMKSLGRLGQAAGMVTSGLIKFSSGAVNAADSLSKLDGSATSVANLFNSVPVLGKAMTAVAGAADRVVQSYNSVSQSGASFGGSISEFSRSASEAGMNLQQFGDLIRKNGDGMLGFGTTTEDGAKNFAAVSKNLRSSNSELYALGMSTADINQGLASYGALLRAQGLQGKKSNEELAMGAKNYLKEMDALAKITGEERSQKEAQAKKLAADAQFQASMMGLNEDVRNSFRDTVLGLPGPLQDFTKDIMANGVATTAENQKLMSMMPESAAMIAKFQAKMQRGEAVTMEERNALNNLMRAEGGAQLKNIKQAGAASSELAGVVNGLAATQTLNANGVKEATEAQKRAAANTDAFNERMQKFQQRISEISNTFQGLLANSGILDVLMRAFDKVAKLAIDYLVPAFNIASSMITKVGEGLGMVLSPVIDYISAKFGANGLGGTVEMIDNVMNTVFGVLGGVVRGAILAFDGLWDGVMALVDPFKNLMNVIFGSSDSVGSFGDILIDVGAFVGDALRVFGTILGVVIDGIAIVAKPLVEIFKGLVNIVKGTIDLFSNFGNYWTDLMDVFDSMSDGLLRFLNKVTLGAAGISEEEQQRRETTRALAKSARDLANEEKIRSAEQHKEELAADKKAFAEKKLTSDKVTAQAKKEAEAKEAAIKAQEKKNTVDMNAGPEELMKQFAKAEGSPLVPKDKTEAAAKAETTKREIENKAEEKVKAEEKAKEQTKKETESKSTAPTQESAETLLAQLNSNMVQLVKLTKEQKDIGERQLSVQKGLTGDLFAA